MSDILDIPTNETVTITVERFLKLTETNRLWNEMIADDKNRIVASAYYCGCTHYWIPKTSEVAAKLADELKKLQESNEQLRDKLAQKRKTKKWYQFWK